MSNNDSMSVTGNPGSGVNWGGNGGNGNNGGGSNSNGNGTGGVTGNWAGAGPVNQSLINAAILEAIKNGLPRDTVAATSTAAYQAMRSAFNSLPLNQQLAARNQITAAWQNAHNAMPDKITTGGGNRDNEAKKTQAQAVTQISNDIQNALNQHQAEWDAAHPVEVAERQVNEIEIVRQQEQNNVNQKQAALNQLKNTTEGRLITDPVAHPILYETNSYLSIPGLNSFTLVLSIGIATREQLNQLLKYGGVAYVNNVLQWGEVTAPTEDGRIVGNGVKTATANEYENLRQRIINRQNEINAAQSALNSATGIYNQAAQKKAEAEANVNLVKDAVKFTADFYKTVTEKYGEKSSKIAQELAEAAKGKQIRSVDEALKAFDKYKDVLNKKFSVKDREAIAKALESLDRNLMAKNLAKFSKAFGVVGKAIDGVDVVKEINNGMDTGNWRPLLVKLETLAVGKGAASLVAFTFGVMTASPLGILGFGLLMVITSTLINDELMEKINKYVLGL